MVFRLPPAPDPTADFDRTDPEARTPVGAPSPQAEAGRSRAFVGTGVRTKDNAASFPRTDRREPAPVADA
jgi:hypothetical protein